MNFRAVILLLLATYVSALAVPPVMWTLEEGWTNAKRFAANLAPLKPKSLYAPTKVLASRHSASPSPSPSSGPTSVCSGFVSVYSVGQGPSGWLSATVMNATGVYSTTTMDKSQALKVSIPCITKDHSALKAYNGPDKKTCYVGFIQEEDEPDIGAGSENFGLIGPTAWTDSGAKPAVGDNYYDVITDDPTLIEASVWKYNSKTTELTAAWINTDGSSVPSTLFWDTDYYWFGFTGDLGKLISEYGSGNNFVQVKFYLDA
ncbi:hypothetical protein DACRYDRAFT_92553 [Dacryopinax primogenitus]|uniref:Concanavalin A-like lectin/glucanase n=1 Tax=Dacryopinax primogenitus (strain DJM 731) TaxID=1858805 RepID=M5GH53_DACPD|nr:uncharacterized protein DACRYDRAFT_92553 [Dacryopinax primogenitus]EJU06638.1 hypothetical protein DACRYDRAFT_92553 [Dacryopinax primogenitus]